ncbi:S-layer homology domain-containing protein [Thermus sp. CCB_US3_UF1]|uniref:S-layer homology domain-containing protein n=1 Tax=Thermus sp. CCB_US3_UF1 TaxID=1111069 RepID=UPI00059E0E3A|nr:S-layer homology domain-containing protein [Thermus sp. CCB_US3_UF1]
MKKKLVMLLAGLLTVLSMGFGLAQFSDVPAGHWAKEAVEALAAKGIIVGFPDGTFRGNEGLTRYQAALIIYRLLQQIQEELKAKGESPTMEALSAEELEALKNAVQELAAELAALGVRVSALEDSAATKEDIARLEALIAELKAQPAPEPGMDAAALQDLADRVEAASIAADTALAQAQQLAEQLDALAQDVEGVKGDLAVLSSLVEGNTQAIQALNELAVLLNQDVLTLQDRATALEKGLADLRAQFQAIDFEEFATREDVAAVQEFVAALRSDLVNLADKVSRLEGTVGKLQTDLNGVSGRVSTLERNRLTISGSLGLRYEARDGNFNLNGGSDYDVDRLIPGTILSTGDADNDGNVVEQADLTAPFPKAPVSGATNAELSLRLQTGTLDARSSGGANAYPGLVQFSIRGSWTNPSSGAAASTFNLVVDRVSTTLRVAEDQPLTFVFGRSVNTKFTEYVMDNESNSLGHGFVATLRGLPLGGTLTAAYGERNPVTADFDYFKALRLALSPLQGLSFGLSYAQHDVAFEEVAGADGSLDLGFAKLSGEYFRYGANIFSATYKEGAYLRAELGPVKANVRGFDAGAAPDPAGLSLDNDNPFRWGQRGFTVEAGLPILGLNLGLLYNAQMDTAFGTPSASAFRASADLGLPAGFKLSARGTLASNTAGEWFPSTYNFTGVPGPASATDYATAIVATLSHDGKAKDAFIQGLNLTLSYTNRTLLGGANDGLAAFGDFGGLALGPISVDRVVFRYNDSNLQNAAAGQTLKGGIRGGINLAGLPLNPSLTGELAYRESQTNISELKYGFGVRFGQFLFDKSVLEVKAAQYTAQGLALYNAADADNAFNAAVDQLYTTATQAGTRTLSGLYVTWNYWDLAFIYGVFKDQELGNLLSEVFNRNLTGNFGSVFRIQYTVNF